MWDDIARAVGFEPTERRTAWAICSLLYEYDGDSPDTPRRISLVSIGKWLTSKSDDEEACRQAATRHVGQLFNHAIPRTGYQILTRYKSEQGSNKAHEYGHDRITQVAALFSELLADKRRAIFADKNIEKKARGEKINEARGRLVADALNYLPPCDTELITQEGESYAYISAAEAKAYCTKNPEYQIRAYTYIPPSDPKEKPRRPFYSEDFDRIEGRILTKIEAELEEALARNSFDEARHFAARLQVSIPKGILSWAKVAGASAREQVEEHEELYTHDKSDMPDPVENWQSTEAPSHDKLLHEAALNSFADNADENDILETDPVETLSVSESFDDTLTAAIFYAKDGWAVVPCCQFDPASGRCTGPDSHHKDGVCKGKRPLIKGRKDAKPGDGYTAASRDKGLIRDWFTRQFPAAGVALRLDGHILIDCDVKDGARGVESYEILADTFNLPSTLSAVTPSGGRHYIFKLPEGLPADFLGSWTRVLDSAELSGIDIKVNNKGLAHVEPTRGKAGVYRWLDPTAEIAELSRECCDYLHAVREQQRAQQEENAESVANAQPFSHDEDQAKYFKDVPVGKRRPRLLRIARRIRACGGDAEEIKKVLKYHASHFTEPLDDQPWIDRVARECEIKFAPEVSK